jgi:hypothetical protein
VNDLMSNIDCGSTNFFYVSLHLRFEQQSKSLPKLQEFKELFVFKVDEMPKTIYYVKLEVNFLDLINWSFRSKFSKVINNTVM